MLTLGRRVASGLGVDLDWLIVGPAPADAADVGSRYVVAHIDLASSIPAEFSPDTYVAALADYAKQATPCAMLFLQTYEARLVAPRLAARLGSAVVMNAVDANVDGGSIAVEATAYGGDTRVVYRCGEARLSVIGVTAG
ncbi:MAG TPA: hypothetical protein VNL92_00035, partial [Dehalococcoidia bacterium]|nr:hypothetical protein [Dehalococcoidia bacterium]